MVHEVLLDISSGVYMLRGFQKEWKGRRGPNPIYYIGITVNLPGRFRAHKERVKEFIPQGTIIFPETLRMVRLADYKPGRAGLTVERKYITAALRMKLPLFNIALVDEIQRGRDLYAGLSKLDLHEETERLKEALEFFQTQTNANKNFVSPLVSVAQLVEHRSVDTKLNR